MTTASAGLLAVAFLLVIVAINTAPASPTKTQAIVTSIAWTLALLMLVITAVRTFSGAA